MILFLSLWKKQFLIRDDEEIYIEENELKNNL